jgi:hypothetical protein
LTTWPLRPPRYYIYQPAHSTPHHSHLYFTVRASKLASLTTATPTQTPFTPPSLKHVHEAPHRVSHGNTTPIQASPSYMNPPCTSHSTAYNPPYPTHYKHFSPVFKPPQSNLHVPFSIAISQCAELPTNTTVLTFTPKNNSFSANRLRNQLVHHPPCLSSRHWRLLALRHYFVRF